MAPGEIVGLAGIAGNGQSEFLRALAGLEPASGAGQPRRAALSLGNPVSAQRGGIAYMPADRHGEGLLMALSVRENATLSSLGRYASNGVVSRRAEVAAVRARGRCAADPHHVAGDRRRGALGRQPAEGGAGPGDALRAEADPGRRADAGRRRRCPRRDLPDPARDRRVRRARAHRLLRRARARGPVRPRGRVLARARSSASCAARTSRRRRSPGRSSPPPRTAPGTPRRRRPAAARASASGASSPATTCPASCWRW